MARVIYNDEWKASNVKVGETMEEKKVYTYSFNRGTKEWSKFSLNTLCSPSDKLRKERETIIRDFLDIYGLPHTTLRPDLTKAKYQVIRLLPSNTIIVAGTGMSVSLLNTANIDKISQMAVPLDIGYTNATRMYLAIYPKDQKKRWQFNGTQVISESKKSAREIKKLYKDWKLMYPNIYMG